MCEWGNTKTLMIAGRLRDIDLCIYPFVKMMNDNGYETIACCCGHGKQPGSIIYNDNGTEREIRIMTFEQGRVVDKLFPPINS